MTEPTNPPIPDAPKQPAVPTPKEQGAPKVEGSVGFTGTTTSSRVEGSIPNNGNVNPSATGAAAAAVGDAAKEVKGPRKPIGEAAYNAKSFLGKTGEKIAQNWSHEKLIGWKGARLVGATAGSVVALKGGAMIAQGIGLKSKVDDDGKPVEATWSDVGVGATLALAGTAAAVASLAVGGKARAIGGLA